MWARVRGPFDQISVLREKFTLPLPGAEYMRWGDGKMRFVKKGDVFLSGLTWRAVQTLVSSGFPKPQVRWPILAVAEQEPLTGRRVELRDYQEATVQKMTRARRMGVQSPTGSGKTRIGVEAARRIGRKTLWLTHRKELMTQTVEQFESLLGVECGQYGSGRDVEGDGRVTVAMVQSLGRAMDEKRGDPATAKAWLSRFGCVIADEGHHASADSWQAVLEACAGANFRFALSATLDTGHDVTNWKIEGATGPTWVVAATMELANRGFLARPRIVLLRVDPSSYPTYEEVRDVVCPEWRESPRNLLSKGAALFSETYERGIVDNEARNRRVVDVISRHVAAGERVLALCTRVRHMEALRDRVASGVSQMVLGLDGGASETVRGRALAAIRSARGGAALVATPFFREGVDLPQVDVGFLAGGGLSDTAVTQGLGRMLRKRPDKDEVLIYDFEDGGNPRTRRPDKDYLAQHSSSRMSLWGSEGFVVERA